MTPRQASALRIIQRHHRGITMLDLALVMVEKRSACIEDLKALQAAGAIGNVLVDGRRLWASTEHMESMRAMLDEARSAKLRKRRDRLTPEQRAEEEAACQEFARSGPIRRRLPQSEWAGRVTISGPSSVFEFGGWV